MMRIVPISEIKASEYNPRINLEAGSDEYKKIKDSLERYGYVEPIVVNDVNMHCVGGHQRLAVMRDIGVKNVNCSFVHIDDEQQEMKLSLALNKIKGRWDEEKLEEVIASLDEEEYPVSYYPLPELIEKQEDIEDTLLAEQSSDSDDGNEETEEIHRQNVIVKIGSYNITLTRQEYDEVIDSIRDSGLFEKEEIIAEIQRRLTSYD